MRKIYNEVVIDMNPESPTYKETLYEDSFMDNGPIVLCKGAKWKPSKGAWGIFGSDPDSEYGKRHTKYGTYDVGKQGFKQQGEEIMATSFEGMGEQMTEYLGVEDDPNTPDIDESVEGILDQANRLKQERLGTQEKQQEQVLEQKVTGLQEQSIKLGSQYEGAISKGGFATSGEVETQREIQEESIATKGQFAFGSTATAIADIGIQKEQSILQLQKDKTDFISKIKSDYNSLLMQYHNATGEAYEGTDDIDAMLTEYDSQSVTPNTPNSPMSGTWTEEDEAWRQGNM